MSLSSCLPLPRFCAVLSLLAAAATAQSVPPPNDPVQKLPELRVTGTASIVDKFSLPQATEGIGILRVQETINLVDTGDAVKYLPSLFLRKRNAGDTQPTLGSRVWGVSSSARSLVYADGVLLTPLIANNNSIGAPRWGLVAPAEIERVDVMYGPFAAAYPGNSMGAVMEITTRLPEKLSASVQQTMAWQSFAQYGTTDTYRTSQTAASVGYRAGRFSFWASGNFQDSRSQPLAYVTTAVFPNGTTGLFPERNKFGQPAHVAGAGGLLHTQMINAKLKAAFDFAPALRATYTLGFWQNGADSEVQTYLRNAAGEPTFAGIAGFASNTSRAEQEHSMHSLALNAAGGADWDFEAVAATYRMDKDAQRLPLTAATSGTTFAAPGRVAVLAGTGWSTFDAKGAWRRGGKPENGNATFGLHFDQVRLANATYNTPDWRTDAARTSVFTSGSGQTRTQAAWAQHAWPATGQVKLTLGARYETWRAFAGANTSGATTVRQPEVRASGFSPKATAAWTFAPEWTLTGSVAQAYRFPTPAELYQLVSTGNTFTAPNPNLRPEDVLAAELKLERKLPNGRARLSWFEDQVRDALISQFSLLVPGSPTLFQFIANVDHVRARGAELALARRDLLVRGLEVAASATYLDARTLALSGRASATAPAGSAVGKFLPNIPKWRGTVTTTYRPTERFALSVAGRYSGKRYTTLDNADVNPNPYQGFTQWFVMDAKASLRVDRHWSASLGVDNALDRKYFLFHPFPQRTVVATVRAGL
ncbi:MAG TPA: TonB-dependent receptor [Opitutaceae bacterium]|nr:TonB-dependent receptor [Opitutaceae bacterium]